MLICAFKYASEVIRDGSVVSALWFVINNPETPDNSNQKHVLESSSTS